MKELEKLINRIENSHSLKNIGNPLTKRQKELLLLCYKAVWNDIFDHKYLGNGYTSEEAKITNNFVGLRIDSLIQSMEDN